MSINRMNSHFDFGISIWWMFQLHTSKLNNIIQTKMKPIQLIFFFTMTLGLTSCIQEKKSDNPAAKIADNVQDTIIVRQKHVLNKPHEVGLLSKSYSYYWLAGKDTLDFTVRAREYAKDSTLHLSVHHKNPALFSTVLKKINGCFPIIKEDFYMSKLYSLYFREPVYYQDLAKELATEYEQQFGRKNINHAKLNQFLLGSKLNTQLESLVNPMEKSVEGYGIEKFHLMDKKYFKSYLPDADLTAYPEFTLHGMGLYVQLESQKK